MHSMKEFSKIEQMIAVLKSEKGRRADLGFGVMKVSYGTARSVDGYDCYDFMAVNELAEKDPDRYFSVIETTQYDDIASEMLCGLLMPFSHKGATEDFMSLFMHLGAKGVLLLLRLLIDDYVDVRTMDTNQDLIWAIIDASEEYRGMLLMGTLAYVIYSTRGALEQKLGNELADSVRDVKLRLMDEIMDRYESDCSKLGYDDFVCFFNLNAVGDTEQLERMQETGLSGRLEGCYADALMLARRLDMKLTEDQLWSLTRGALLSNDISHYWATRDLPTLSLYLADAICSSGDARGMWKQVSNAMQQALYRESRQYYLGAPGRSKSVELYLCLVPNVIENLIADDQLADACAIWFEAWNVCVTALYSWTIPSVPFHIVQFLFVYKVVYLSPYTKVWDNDKLLSQLPVVWLQAGCFENVATACLRTLARNLPDGSFLGDNEPDLSERLVAIGRDNESPKKN